MNSARLAALPLKVLVGVCASLSSRTAIESSSVWVCVGRAVLLSAWLKWMILRTLQIRRVCVCVWSGTNLRELLLQELLHS